MRKTALFAAVCLLALAACGTPGNVPTPAEVKAALDAAAPVAFKYSCGAIFYADGMFQATAPALIVAGKLAQADLDKEKMFLLSAHVTCDNPPADLAQAGLDLAAQTASIYLMLAPKS